MLVINLSDIQIQFQNQPFYSYNLLHNKSLTLISFEFKWTECLRIVLAILVAVSGFTKTNLSFLHIPK